MNTERGGTEIRVGYVGKCRGKEISASGRGLVFGTQPASGEKKKREEKIWIPIG